MTRKNEEYGGEEMKERAPALTDAFTFRRLWEAFGSRLAEAVREHLLYTQGPQSLQPRSPEPTLAV